MKKITILFLLVPLFSFTQTSGNLNPNYGNNGIFGVSKHLGFDIDDASLQGDKILIYGKIQTNTLNEIVLRVNSDGSLDKTFADNGVIQPNLSTYSYDNYIQTFTDGKFILCTNIVDANNQKSVLLNKYTVNGEKDTSFGNNGNLLLDYLPYNASVSNKPLIVPDASKVILPILIYNSVGNASTGSTLHKLEADGTVDDEFGDNGYVNFANSRIETLDRNPYSSNWIESVFGGVEGDMILCMRTFPGSPVNFYGQYVTRSGVYTDNRDSNEGISKTNSLFQGRFYEYNDLLFGKSSSLSYFTNVGQYFSSFNNDLPTNSENTNIYNTIKGSAQKPGFKVLDGGDSSIIFGTKFNQNFIGNLVIKKQGKDSFSFKEIDLSGDDRMIDCFEKPNGKIVCFGTSNYFINNSQESGLRRPSMVQMAANGSLDASFGIGGIYLGNPFFEYNSGIVVSRFDGRTGKNVSDWIGTATEPYTGKQRIERVFLTSPNASTSETLTRTSFNEVKINNGIAYGAIAQNDSQLLVGYVNNNGNYNFMMYRENTFSEEFGGLTNSIVQTDINNGSNDEATGAVIQNDNGVKKILVVGESDGNLAMVRYFADGNDAGLIDTSFGVNGIFSKSSNLKQSLVTIPFIPSVVKSTDDGILYMCGEEINVNTHFFALKKFDSSGNEDTSFQAFDELTNISNVAQDFEILSDGSFIVIGQTGNYETKIRKYNQDGTPDTNFGTNSYLYLETGAADAKLNDIIILEDGRVAVVGYVDNDALVSLFDQEGSLDLSFANNGILRTNYDFDSIKLTSLEQEDESNILISGISEKDGVSNVFSAQVLIQDALGINEFNKDSFSLYPNPASTSITIKSKSNTPIKGISFYDALGKQIKKVDAYFENIDLKNLSNGLYFLKIKTDNGKVSKKLVIDK